ncbi:MAG: hypothetical protein SFY67_04035 [Candidatus Melainabacteria bacterium]|nr:hypothetical protein [Candidatus Melainabacteria bacterium]
MRPQTATATYFLLLAIFFSVDAAQAQLDDAHAGYRDYRKIQEIEMDNDLDKLFDFGYQPDKAARLKHDKLDEDQEDSRRAALRSRFREFDIGHDFDQKSFSQTLDNDMRSHASKDPQEVDRQDAADLRDDDHDKDKRDDERRKDRRRAFLSDEELMRELSRLPEAAPDDWVPDKADPVNNGGFSIAPDNGSPVPYKLNGWIDFQRKYPWEDEN